MVSDNLKSERIFLAYANNPLKENPGNLWKVYEAIEGFIGQPSNQLGPLRGAVEGTVELMKMGPSRDFSDFLRHRDSIQAGQDFKKKCYLSYFLPVYGYENGFCEKNCAFRSERAKFLENEQLTCLECDQFAFIDMLDSIIEGDESEQRLGVAKAKSLVAEPNRYFSSENILLLDLSKILCTEKKISFPKGNPLSFSWYLLNGNKPFDLRDFLNQAVAWSLKNTWENLRNFSISPGNSGDSVSYFLYTEDAKVYQVLLTVPDGDCLHSSLR